MNSTTKKQKQSSLPPSEKPLGTVKIRIVDPITCRVSVADKFKIQVALQYPATYWTKGKFSKNEISYTKKHWSHNTKMYSFFHTGLLDRVVNHLEKNQYKVDIVTDDWFIKSVPPSLPGISLREDQINLINIARKKQRGVIQSVTGSGKTIMQMGLVSSFETSPILILIHTSDLVKQTVRNLHELGFGEETQQIGAGAKPTKVITKPIVVATMQSFSKLDPKYYIDMFEVVIIDECHHVSKMDGTYGKILGSLAAPVRLGFTATLPTSQEATFSLEGYIGPLIGKLGMEEAIEKEIMVKPNIKIQKVPRDPKIRKLTSYPKVYDKGIIHNSARNSMIVDIAKRIIEKKETSLIIVTKLEQGDLLQELIKKELRWKVPFVEGRMSPEDRLKVQNNLIKKKIPIAICTTVWREGIDIPPLENVILAGIGKSEIMTLQTIGRGARKSKGKKTVTIWDFFDNSHHHLINHFGERISLYIEMGWL